VAVEIVGVVGVVEVAEVVGAVEVVGPLCSGKVEFESKI
jgi:hypothetical protein